MSKWNRMNFGCGSTQPRGWINYDSDPTYKADLPKDFKFATLDGIVANYVLQQIQIHNLPATIHQLWMMLRPNAVLRIILPDIVGGFSALLSEATEWFPNDEETVDERFCNWLTWYGENITPLTYPLMKKLLEDSAFRRVSLVEYRYTRSDYSWITELDDRKSESIFVEAIK